MFYQWRKNRKGTISNFPVVIGLLGLFFVLLTVFLISSQRIPLPGTTIELPKFSNEESTPVSKLVVTVTADGALFFNAQKLKDVGDLETALKDLSEDNQNRKNRIVVFYADQRVPLSTMAQLFDIARAHNFNAYLATSGDTLRAGKNNVPDDDESF